MPSPFINEDHRCICRNEIKMLCRFHATTTVTYNNKVNSSVRCVCSMYHRILRIVVILGYVQCFLAAVSHYFLVVSAFLPFTSTILPFISTNRKSISRRIEFSQSIPWFLQSSASPGCDDATAAAAAIDMAHDGDSALTTQSLRDRYTNAIPLWLIDKCEECGYVYPTRIQEQVFDEVLLSSNNNHDDTTGGNSNSNLIVDRKSVV